VNHRLYQHPQRCIKLRIAAAASTFTILSISSLLPLRTTTATTVFYCYRWQQPLSITTTLHSCRSRPPPFSTATAKFLTMPFSIAAIFYRRRFLPIPLNFYRCFLPPPLFTVAAFYRRRFLPPLSTATARYRCLALPTSLSTAPATTAATVTATTAATAFVTTATSRTAATASTASHTTTAAADRCCCFNDCYCSLLQTYRKDTCFSHPLH
jgi:hypothetical protein